MGTGELVLRAERLRALHRPGDPLVLPTIWDAASAGAAAEAGLAAVGTSSGALAGALGWGDHEQMPRDVLLRILKRIGEAVPVPVSADMESGYGLGAGPLVEALASAGIAGLNLEDSDPKTLRLRPAGEQAAWLASVRREAQALGVPLVLNARVDVWLHGEGDEAARMKESHARARRYADAGADCVFPIGLKDSGLIAEFVRGAGAPVNVLVAPEPAEVARVRALGVARVSFGKGLFRSLYADLKRRLGDIQGV